jgi:hypothetical protein
MDQFGLEMDFLGIKQVQMIIFTLKIHFHNYLSILCVLWTERIIIRKCRGIGVNFSVKNRISGPHVISFLKLPRARALAPMTTDLTALGVDAQGHHTTNGHEQNIGRRKTKIWWWNSLRMQYGQDLTDEEMRTEPAMVAVPVAMSRKSR